jgi:hypothetical protein
MSSPKRPSSLTSIELAHPPREKINIALPHPTDELSDPWLVSFGPNDPENPLVRPLLPLVRHLQYSYYYSQNWPRWRRWYLTILGGVLVLNASVLPMPLERSFTYPIGL